MTRLVFRLWSQLNVVAEPSPIVKRLSCTLAARAVFTVVEKAASSARAAASSLSVSRADGAESTRLAIAVAICAGVAFSESSSSSAASTSVAASPVAPA